MENFYTYIYFDPRKPGSYMYEDLIFNFEPIYVGKGQGNRYLKHLKDKTQTIKATKIRKIISEGFDPIIVKIKENISEYEAKKLEAEIMKKIGTIVEIDVLPRGPLTNTRYTSSFESDCLSQETKQKLSTIVKNSWTDELKTQRSEEMRKKWQDPEYRESQTAKIAEVERSEEKRKQKSEKGKEVWQRQEYRDKKTGVKRSINARKNMSIGRKKMIQEKPDYIKAMSETQKKVMENPEIRKKISDKISGRKWYHNPSDGKSKALPENEIQHYIDLGWVSGRLPGRKNKKKRPSVRWMTRIGTKETRQILLDQVDIYQSNGWIIGRKL
ncbi:MAG: GIY-YIG nuclease family protein [Gammaproteobacteria bacterium]|nr:GIY-YIG nuclease family protein [Gammaproteobacteria bacterium]